MKVKELIKYLQTQDPDNGIGFLDHFGEFHPVREQQLGKRVLNAGTTRKKVQVVVIEPPDFGPEPD